MIFWLWIKKLTPLYEQNLLLKTLVVTGCVWLIICGKIWYQVGCIHFFISSRWQYHNKKLKYNVVHWHVHCFCLKNTRCSQVLPGSDTLWDTHSLFDTAQFDNVLFAYKSVRIRYWVIIEVSGGVVSGIFGDPKVHFLFPFSWGVNKYNWHQIFDNYVLSQYNIQI